MNKEPEIELNHSIFLKFILKKLFKNIEGKKKINFRKN